MVAVPVARGNTQRLRPVSGNRTATVRQTDMVGQSLQRLGGALGQAADDVDRIDAVYDDAGATELVNQYQEYARARLRTDDDAYYTRRGMDAGTDRPTYEEMLSSYREELLSEATNDRMRSIANRQIERLYGRDVEQMAAHSDREMTVARDAASRARITNNQQDFIDFMSAGDTGAANDSMLAALSELQGVANRNGWDGDTLAMETEALVSGAHIAVANNMVALGNPTQAMGYIEEHADEITPAAEAQIRAQLGPAVDTSFAESRVSEIMAGAEPMPAGAPETEATGDTIVFAEPLGGQGVTVRGGEWGAPRDYNGDGVRNEGHTGVDYAAPVGTPINPTAPGRVTFVGRRGGYGNQVVVDHGGGLETRYSHMSSFNVREGQQVAAGEVLGGVGNTGRSSGPHLHYQVFRDGRPVNPSTVVSAPRGSYGGGEGFSTAAVRARVEADIAANNYSERRQQAMRDAADRYVTDRRAMRAESEGEADRQAIDFMVNNFQGRSFTSINQIPPALLAALSPSGRARLVEAAQANREEITDESRDQHRVAADGFS